MAKQIIFISSVQQEFASERQVLFDYLQAYPLLGLFFEPFLFERLPAIDQRTDEVYLKEVRHCSIYLGLFGKEYGFEDDTGISPTEREFDKASELHKTRLIYLTNHSSSERQEKENKLIQKAQYFLIRRRFSKVDELKDEVYDSLVNYLKGKGIIQLGPFDATSNAQATLADIDEEKVKDFVRVARSRRGFPLRETDSIEDIFTHLNLIHDKTPTNAALLLFGKHPQRFFISSEVRCAHFHGTIVEKPIPSYQVFKGDVFELVDQSVDFILSKLDYSVGTRAEETMIPGKYEIPKEVVSKAIVNAVAHRDYTSNGSVQIHLFRDRLEIINPGVLPLGWSEERLKKPHTSIPFNPLLAEPMYLKGYIERMGTGTLDMVRISKEFGLKEPLFRQEEDFKTVIFRPITTGVDETDSTSAPQVPHKYPTGSPQAPQKYHRSTVEVRNLLKVLGDSEMSRKQIQETLGLKDINNFRENYINPALELGLIEMKYPDSPNHPKQKYLMTGKGKMLLESL